MSEKRKILVRININKPGIKYLMKEVNLILRTYSTIVVIDSLLKSDEIDNTIEKVERNIKNNGGEILDVERWGKKRLAYMIKKRQYGYYVEIFFKGKGDIVKIIEREYGLDENILRYLSIILDKKALQYRQKEKMRGTLKNQKDEQVMPKFVAHEEEKMEEENEIESV